MFDSFISYGRADSKDFATKLHERLIGQGLRVWFDQHDIPPAVDWQNQIDDGIERSHNFIFIITPHSVKSLYCHKEIELAVKYNKRIIPLLYINSNNYWEHMPEEIQTIIKKTNWIFVEEKNDFEEFLAKLLATINQESDYVQQHTKLLIKALEWLRNNKQTNYLLVGKERIQANEWLKRKFTESQPPCLLTDWHSEYICESNKNADNLMTQVFIAASEKDKDVKTKIGQTLMREGITIWTNKTDIKTRAEFQSEIERGVEGADNFVYLISPDTLTSEYCQQELQHAMTHHKRIITLAIDSVSPESIPVHLHSLQFLDFTKHHDEECYRRSSNNLIDSLKQDAPYYEEHKRFLVKALKWKQQNYNHSILLHGHSLRRAQTWLQIAQQHRYHTPTELQSQFIEASRRQPPAETLDIFISYSRVDGDLARRLNDDLQTQGKTTWFEQESIPPEEDFHSEIRRGIETSDNFLFIISPDSLDSCDGADGVKYAQQLNKRVITVLYRSVSIADLPSALASFPGLDFRSSDQDSYYRSFSELIRILEVDREYVQNHTKWWQRAKNWEQYTNGDEGLL